MFKQFPLGIFALIALGGGPLVGCAVEAEPTSEGVDVSSAALNEARAALPLDSTVQSSTSDRPTKLVKAAKFTRTPPDRVEILEGTYRTVVSRRFLLEAIKQADGEYRTSLVQTYRGVLPNLTPAAAQAAETELDGVLTALDKAEGQQQ